MRSIPGKVEDNVPYHEDEFRSTSSDCLKVTRDGLRSYLVCCLDKSRVLRMIFQDKGTGKCYAARDRGRRTS